MIEIFDSQREEIAFKSMRTSRDVEIGVRTSQYIRRDLLKELSDKQIEAIPDKTWRFLDALMQLARHEQRKFLDSTLFASFGYPLQSDIQRDRNGNFGEISGTFSLGSGQSPDRAHAVLEMNSRSSSQVGSGILWTERNTAVLSDPVRAFGLNGRQKMRELAPWQVVGTRAVVAKPNNQFVFLLRRDEDGMPGAMEILIERYEPQGLLTKIVTPLMTGKFTMQRIEATSKNG